MFHCEQCGAEFMNSDEFNAHMQRHLSEKAEEWKNLMERLMKMSTREIDKSTIAFAEMVAEVVAERLSPLLSTSQQVVLPKPSYTFEAMQLTSIAAASNKSADEVLSLYREILAKLESESQGRGI